MTRTLSLLTFFIILSAQAVKFPFWKVGSVRELDVVAPDYENVSNRAVHARLLDDNISHTNITVDSEAVAVDGEPFVTRSFVTNNAPDVAKENVYSDWIHVSGEFDRGYGTALSKFISYNPSTYKWEAKIPYPLDSTLVQHEFSWSSSYSDPEALEIVLTCNDVQKLRSFGSSNYLVFRRDIVRSKGDKFTTSSYFDPIRPSPDICRIARGSGSWDTHEAEGADPLAADSYNCAVDYADIEVPGSGGRVFRQWSRLVLYGERVGQTSFVAATSDWIPDNGAASIYSYTFKYGIYEGRTVRRADGDQYSVENEPFVTSTYVNDQMSTKQDALTAGRHVIITNNVISVSDINSITESEVRKISGDTFTDRIGPTTDKVDELERSMDTVQDSLSGMRGHGDFSVSSGEGAAPYIKANDTIVGSSFVMYMVKSNSNAVVSIGPNDVNDSAHFSILVGKGNSSVGTSCLAIGTGNKINGFSSMNSIAGGNSSEVRGSCSLAFGQNAKTDGSHSISFGHGATVTGDFGTAIGSNATAKANSVAIGPSSSSGNNAGVFAAAIGQNATAKNGGIALGINASAQDNSIALGPNVAASRPLSFVWNGANSTVIYESPESGSFCINPEFGPYSFYIGTSNLIDIILREISNAKPLASHDVFDLATDEGYHRAVEAILQVLGAKMTNQHFTVTSP